MAPAYRRLLAKWKVEFGAYDVQALTPRLIATSKFKLRGERTRRGTERNAATVNRYLGAPSSALSWAKRPEIGLVERNVVLDVAKFKEASRPGSLALSADGRADVGARPPATGRPDCGGRLQPPAVGPTAQPGGSHMRGICRQPLATWPPR